MKRLSPLIGRGGRGGFTLVEMLFVVLIMVILIALAVRPMLLGRAVSVTTAGNQVMEDLAYARELAIANNQPVEVWFLRPTGGTYLTGIQLNLVDQTGTVSSYGGVYPMRRPAVTPSRSASAAGRGWDCRPRMSRTR